MGRTSDARERLIEEASRLFHQRSYEGVGAVIDAYWIAIRDELLTPALARDLTPLARIERFFDQLTREQRAGRRDLGATPGCPLANLAGELCNH